MIFRRMKPTAVLGAAVLTLFVTCWTPLSAQEKTAAPAPQPTTRGEARDMVASLSDQDVRRLLLEHLDRSLPEGQAEQPERDLWLLLDNQTVLDQLSGLVEHSNTFGDELRRIADGVAGDMSHPWLSLLATIVVCFAAGALLERFMLRPRGVLGGLDTIARTATAGRLSPSQVFLGTACRSMGAFLFFIGTLLALHLMPGLSEGARTLASVAIWLVAGTRLVSAALHALLLPVGGESPWPVSRPVAAAVARYLSIVAAFVLLKALDRDVLGTAGCHTDLVLAVVLFDSILLIGSILVAIFAVRRAMGPIDKSARGVAHYLRERWHLLAAGYVLFVLVFAVYAALVTGVPVLWRALASLSLVLVIPVVDYGLRRLAARIAPGPVSADASPPVLPPQDDVPDFEEVRERGESAEAALPPPDDLAIPEARAEGGATPDAMPAPADKEPSAVEAALVVNFRVLLALAVLKLIDVLWELHTFELVASVFGAGFAGALTEIAVAALFAFIVWQIVKAALAAYAVPETDGFDLGGDGGAAGQSRVQTLMPLIAKTIGVVLVVMLALIALSAFGVNIGPLLAGAGVLGLAVGFGAQTLVKDIVSGVFYLFDDAFRMGEYLTIGNIRGTVEKISVRSLRLRHHRGPLHTLPYGEIHTMTNYSRDYAIMKFELRVPFETDVEKVRKLIKQVGVQLAENEEWASVMLEPLKSQGVNRMDDSAFVIRCKFTTLPGKQFTIRRVAYAMIQEAFAREGIPFAPKRVVVETVAPAGSKEALAAAAAAADSATEEPPRRASGDDR